MDFLETNEFINAVQCGYQSGRSTGQTGDGSETRICVLNEHVISVFLDLTKAYDTTWRYSTMRDLRGVVLRKKFPRFLSKFLKNR